MDGVLGALAGGGMLVLIGLLITYFLMEMKWLSRENVKWLGRCFAAVLGACILYRLLGALCYFVFYEPVGNAAEYQMIFRSPGLEKMYALLKSPSWQGVATGAFAYIGHGLGKVLFGQYAFAGEVLAFFCSFSGYVLISFRLQCFWGKETGEKMSFLILCMPFSVYFFLPGWIPLTFLVSAMAFFFLGLLLQEKRFSIPDSVYSLIISVFSLLSASMVYMLATGRLM